MQQPPTQHGQWQPPQQGYGQQPYPPQQGQWNQGPYTPYPPQQGYSPEQAQWQQPPPNMQWQQPYGQPPPQQPKKKSKLLLIVGLIVVLVLFACVGASVLASHGSSPNASSTTNSSSLNSTVTSVSNSTPVPTNKHYKQTDAVQVGNIYYMEIISVKTSTGSQIFQPKAGDVFLVLLIKAKNISSQEQAISSLISFSLQDSNGQKYTETINPDAGATIDGKVEPGSLLQGSITYEVPASMKSFTLAFQANFLSQGQVIWDINI